MIRKGRTNMGHEDRKKLQLNIDDILDNNFLIADFMLVPELRERLKNAKSEDFAKLIAHFEDKDNVEAFAFVLSDHYENYLKTKSKKTYDLKMLINSLLEITGWGAYAILMEAAYQLLYNYQKQDKAVEQFIKALESYRIDGVLDLATHSPERFNEEQKKLIERGRNEVRRKAIRVLSGKDISVEVIGEALGMTVEEVKRVLEN